MWYWQLCQKSNSNSSNGFVLNSEHNEKKSEETRACESAARRTAGPPRNKIAASLSLAWKTAWPLVTYNWAQ